MSDRLSFASTITAEGRRIKGSVQLAGARTYRNGEFVEVDVPALMKADRSKAFASMEHDDAKLLGAFTNETLDIRFSDDGFEYETADLPNTSYANDALELVRGGYVTGSSFEIDGLRSSFSTESDGTRVRRYVGIKRLVSVSPVRDPAFPSLAAAFNSKESDVTDIIEEPKVEPKAPPEPATFTEQPKSGKDEWAAFARDLSTEQIEATMEQLFAAAKGDLKDEILDRYEGFAKELGERKRSEAANRTRIERMELQHNLSLGRVPKAPEADLFASDDYREAFTQYLRTGNARHVEQFAQSVAGSGAEGGFTVPDGFLNIIVNRLKAYGGIAGIADEITTSTGESLRFPTNDDTSNSAAIAAEGVAGTAGADLTFGSVDLGAFSYDANGTGNAPLKVSLELLQDSAFDIAAFVGDALGTRIGRKQATDLANGAGGTAPVGLFTKSADTMTATVVSLAAPEHILQVDSEYRDLGNCRWIMSDTTLVKVWQSQTTTNQPLFIPGGSDIVGSPGGRLYGYPITIDAASGTKVAFGDFRRGYLIRRVRGVQVLVDPYTAQNTRQVAYHAWARMDANIRDSFAYSVSEWSGVSADT